ncbi:MAG: hypothetical protein GXO93_05870 [FCB group bacterium]|nr:hypothetical protein [FCB group bacterium]
MKKLITLTFVLLLLLSISSMATDTRVLTMGENNNVLLDDANIWLYPSRTFEYPNLAIGEFNNNYNGTFNQFGIHWKFGTDKPFVLATYFTTLPAVYPTDLNGGSLFMPGFSLLQNRRIDLFYGRVISNYNFGMHFSLTHSSQTKEFTTPLDNQVKSYGYYNFDFGLTPTTDKWDVALDFGLGSWTDESASGGTQTEPDGFYDFSLIGRYFVANGPNYTFIPHVGFYSSKRGIKEYDASSVLTDNTKYTRTVFNIGTGLNYTPATNVLGVFDFGLMYDSWKEKIDVPTPAQENTETNVVVPYFKIGLDADVFKWMDIRLGATSNWTNETREYKPDNNKWKYKYADNETYLGFGFHWNRLNVDTYTDPALFIHGFNFISGNTYDENNDMNFRISASYEMK